MTKRITNWTDTQYEAEINKIIEKTKTGGGNIMRKTKKNDWKSEAKKRAKI